MTQHQPTIIGSQRWDGKAEQHVPGYTVCCLDCSARSRFFPLDQKPLADDWAAEHVRYEAAARISRGG